MCCKGEVSVDNLETLDCRWRKIICTLRMTSRYKAGGPAELQWKPSGGAVDMQQVSGDKEIFEKFGAHSLGINLCERDAAIGDDRFFIAEEPGDRHRQGF